MLRKIIAYAEQENIFAQGDRIVAGVSGGADSVCLFYVLLELQKQFSLELAVVHVNHGIRAEAWDDEEYVAKLCEENGIAFYPFHEDVPTFAQTEHLSEEEAGRIVRYRAFEQILDQVYQGNGKIAVAHTQNDRAETMLFNLFRGTGLSGLAGMEPVKGRIVRPLLCVNRQEVEQFLSEREISYCQDATNDTDAYARNRIRRHILPYADKEICKNPVGHLNQTAEQLREASDYLRQKIAEAEEKTVIYTQEGARISEKEWNSLHPCLQKGIIHAVFQRLTPAAKDITSVHIRQVCELFKKQTGRRIDLPYHICAVRNYEGVCMNLCKDTLSKAGDAKEPAEDDRIFWNRTACKKEEAPLALEGTEGRVCFGTYEVCWRIFENHQGEDILGQIPKNDFTKWFDYDRINQSVTVRYRRTGDFLVVNAQGGTKSIKQYMIDEKIPAICRAQIPLLTKGDEVLWVIGHRIGEDCKISSQTKNIMEIQISGGNKNG